MADLGMIRVAAATPKIKVANTVYNEGEIIKLMEEADRADAGILLLPELTITGYTVGDLFHQELLYEKQLESLKYIMAASAGRRITLVLGFYFRMENNLYNCAAVIQNGKIKGIVPKMFMPNANEFYEARWFASGRSMAAVRKSVRIFGEEVAFGNIIFKDEEKDLCFGVEICEDLWLPISPSSQLVLNGAHIILNPSASDETTGKADYRRDLVRMQSAKAVCGYAYASAGTSESTTDLVFSGHQIIAECGDVLAENKRFERESCITYAEIDYGKIKYERGHGNNLSECNIAYSDRLGFRTVDLEPVRVMVQGEDKIQRHYAKFPFLPENAEKRSEYCEEIFRIQASALAKRLEHTHTTKSVIGISGGLDSTLALLVAIEAHRLLGLPRENVIAVTMPGFGTTGMTHGNAVTLMEKLGTDIREVSIVPAMKQHFKDIGQDESVHDATYENAQARERTQILMDIAGREGGMVIGTGDLSELALGWCTFNGDHMAMYGVNASVPKTVIRFVVGWYIDNVAEDEILRKTLQSILDTPISPELLPPDESGNIVQKTEDKVGPYELHDFFIYHTMKGGMTPEKLLEVASCVFDGEYDREYINKWLHVFYRRFFSQQFKRSCAPDGPKSGPVSLSPRGDWRMPSDADGSLWQ